MLLYQSDGQQDQGIGMLNQRPDRELDSVMLRVLEIQASVGDQEKPGDKRTERTRPPKIRG